MDALGAGIDLAVRQRRRAFSPAALFAGGAAGAWYDPSDLGSLFADAAGTVPAAVDGPVARIADKSGHGHHAVQGVAAARPMLRRDGNGRCYLAFDGIDDHLVVDAASLAMAQPIAVFVAGRIGEGTADYQRFFDCAPGAPSRLTIGKQGAAAMIAFAGELGVMETELAFPAGPGTWSARFDGAASFLRHGGIEAAGGDVGSNGLAGLTLGAFAGGSGEYLCGRLYGFAIVAGTGEGFAATESWMARKAGL